MSKKQDADGREYYEFASPTSKVEFAGFRAVNGVLYEKLALAPMSSSGPAKAEGRTVELPPSPPHRVYPVQLDEPFKDTASYADCKFETRMIFLTKDMLKSTFESPPPPTKPGYVLMAEGSIWPSSTHCALCDSRLAPPHSQDSGWVHVYMCETCGSITEQIDGDMGGFDHWSLWKKL